MSSLLDFNGKIRPLADESSLPLAEFSPWGHQAA
jgi:hypothetical protein